MDVDLEELAAVVRLLREAEFSEFRYEKGDVSIVVRRGALTQDPPTPVPGPALRPAAAPVAAPATTAVPSRQDAVPVAGAEGAGPAVDGRPVTAPLLGTFYSAPKPGEPPFVSVGDRVEADTVCCIVEVMKLMNSVTVGVAGTVAAVHVHDGDLVEHGQTLFTIDPAAP